MSGEGKRAYFGPVAVGILVLLTAWGNAWAMLSVGAVSLVVGAVVFRGRSGDPGILAATVAAVIAVAMAVVHIAR